ncbi:MAG: peptide deformylase [Planctomycetota bacterium]|jgi:peptide deformylase
MVVRKILLLGDPQLYEVSEPVHQDELDDLQDIVTNLHDTLIDFRKRYNVGRAIAAPQIGVKKRLIYMCVDDVSTVFINPELTELSQEMIEVWDDCLCFPDLRVKVKRHRSCRIRFRNPEWEEEELMAEGNLSELLQHEYDHLDGILAVSRAIDGRSFALRNSSINQTSGKS